MIEKNIPDFPGLVLAVSMIEHGSMPKTTGASPKKLQNRNKFISNLGFDVDKVCQAKLVHGSGIGFVDEDSPKVLRADVLFTDSPEYLSSMAMADCFPILLRSGSRRAISLIHAGWRGAAKEHVVSKAVWMFSKAFNLRAVEVNALVGPGIRKCCFEVRDDENGLKNFAAWPHFVFSDNGKYFVSLDEIIKDQLYRAGVRNIDDCGECTYCSPKGYFSFRRDKNSLRHLAVAGFKGS